MKLYARFFVTRLYAGDDLLLLGRKRSVEQAVGRVGEEAYPYPDDVPRNQDGYQGIEYEPAGEPDQENARHHPHRSPHIGE